MELLLIDGKTPESGEWVYTGSVSRAGKGETYMAEVAGTLIGLVHDPASVIEHRTGLGIGAYGSMSGNTEWLVSVDTPLTLIVENADR